MRTILDYSRSASSSLLGLLPLLFVTACTPLVTFGDGGEGGAPSSGNTSTGRGGGGPWTSTASSGDGVPWTTTASSGGDTTTSSSGGWSTTTASSGGGWSSTTTTSSGGGTACADPTDEPLPAGPCTPSASECNAAKSVCLATVDADAAPSFGMRVAHLGLTAPAALTTGVVQSVFQSSTEQDLQACGVTGSGEFNWLLRFDTAAGTLTTGAAKPIADPSIGYTFIDQTLPLGGTSFAVAPLTLAASVDAACGVSSAAGDVILPFFGDDAGTLMTVFPLRSLRFFNTQVTPDHNCIGALDTSALSPANGCQANSGQAPYLDGGQLEAFISLEEANTVFVPVLEETLCLLLTGNSTTYGTGGTNPKCKRDSSGVIVFKGDWCAATNGPATAGCADAARFAASFAASGTKIN